MTKFLLPTLLLLAWFHGGAQQPSSSDIRGPFVWKSKIYPGTERNYWIYVPKQYDATKPACLMVVQDGLSRATGWNLPRTLDSLIDVKAIPVMVGIFVDHGKVPSTGTDNYPRFNRSFEYDGMGDRYARFLIEELIPEVSKSFNISNDPNDRSIAGASSGAICAFNAAWERPDAFRRVLSTIGTYVGLRGADEFATLVRKTEPKPIRVFLQDGNHDLNIYAGDWWMANQDMLSSLTWAGYEVNHAWGEGGHDSKHTVTIIGDALAWLWKDYPAPVQTHRGTTPRVNPTLEGEGWREIPTLKLKAGILAVNKNGDLFFTGENAIYKVSDDGTTSMFVKIKGPVGGISFHDSGVLYGADLHQHSIFSVNEKGQLTKIVSQVDADFLTATSKGIYFSNTLGTRIGFYSFSKKDVRYVDAPGKPGGLAVNAEKTFLNVSLKDQAFGYSYKIMDDGMPDFGQDYIHYHIPYGKTTPEAFGMTVDADNLLYTATAMGIQVSDQLGRINFILSQPAKYAMDVKLGGPEFNRLYANFDGKLFVRKVSSKGVLPWLPPVKPPRPGL